MEVLSSVVEFVEDCCDGLQVLDGLELAAADQMGNGDERTIGFSCIGHWLEWCWSSCEVGAAGAEGYRERGL